MSKILGLDLGTNSIGWALRETDPTEREKYRKLFGKEAENPNNQVVDYGVVVFEKGVGIGQSGEYSLAGERRKFRSKRRLYNAKRYRKWALLKVLVEENMCPLNLDELRLWSVGNWVEENGKKKNKGRIFPSNEQWIDWLNMHPSFFGRSEIFHNNNRENKIFRKSPYEIQAELTENYIEDSRERLFKVGRALYHMAQRRGFKSSRKSGQSSYAENTEFEEFRKSFPDKFLAHYALEKMKSGQRFRASGVLQRRYYEEQFEEICKKQRFSEDLIEKLRKAIYYVRPIRSQKKLVGKCTLESKKTRIPISHPLFEEFRALSFINNIKWKIVNSNEDYKEIPIEVKRKIFEEIFFKRITKGKNKGKYDERDYFSFEEIEEKLSNYLGVPRVFNYSKSKPTIAACPFIAGLMNTLEETWMNKFIYDNKIGINWDGLELNYTIKYGKIKTFWRKGIKLSQSKIIGEYRKLDVEGIWHLIYDYKVTKDNPNGLKEFAMNVLNWSEEKATDFSAIKVQTGYGALSHKAINNILPYLRKGISLTVSIWLGNLKKIVGNDIFKEHNESLVNDIIKIISKVREDITCINAVNALIRDYFLENKGFGKPLGLTDELIQIATIEIDKQIHKIGNKLNWHLKTEHERNEIRNLMLDKYLRFLDGKQSEEEKASKIGMSKGGESYFYKVPRIDDEIKTYLSQKYGLTQNKLNLLYHHSDIDIYPKARLKKQIIDQETGIVIKEVPQLGNPMPPSKAWKNPMALRTMHELKKLINYLLVKGKIDSNTKIVIEIARELNDSNLRQAIKSFHNERQKENQEFEKIILQLAADKYPHLSENSSENINKIRLWAEQTQDYDALLNETKKLKDDADKYRLWLEQKCMCLYTGKIISLTDLFDGTKFQVEHTIPVTKSFDDSLTNKTICDAQFNANVKSNKIPSQLENHNEILQKISHWENKKSSLERSIKALNEKIKLFTAKGDIENRNKAIQNRHFLRFKLEYWNKKIETFKIKEVPESWKNSQLIDTQIISKYSLAYLKTLFENVRVQKAAVVDKFKKIYGFPQEYFSEYKNRDRHVHHVIDAVCLTLIPGSLKRDVILQEYYSKMEKNEAYNTLPYEYFTPIHIKQIENNVLVFHSLRDKKLSKSKFKVKLGNKVIYKTGYSIRGSLHKDTFLGAIEVSTSNNAKSFNNQSAITPKWVVLRTNINEIELDKDKIVDAALEKHIYKQAQNPSNSNVFLDFNNRPIRHVRCRYKAGRGFLDYETAIMLKPNSSFPTKEHKLYYLVQNDENYLYLLYSNGNVRQNKAQIISLIEFQKIGIHSLSDLFHIPEFNNYQGMPLSKIIKVGHKAIFYEHTPDEIFSSTYELSKRLYIVYKFNVINSVHYLYFKRHDVALPHPDINDNSDVIFRFSNAQLVPIGLKLNPTRILCLFEHYDFIMNPDGKIEFKS